MSVFFFEMGKDGKGNSSSSTIHDRIRLGQGKMAGLDTFKLS